MERVAGRAGLHRGHVARHRVRELHLAPSPGFIKGGGKSVSDSVLTPKMYETMVVRLYTHETVVLSL